MSDHSGEAIERLRSKIHHLEQELDWAKDDIKLLQKLIKDHVEQSAKVLFGESK
jgi:prefoldin subunit 5